MKNYKKVQTKTDKKSVSQKGKDAKQADKVDKVDKADKGKDKKSKTVKKVDSSKQDQDVVKNKTVKSTKKDQKKGKTSQVTSQDNKKSPSASQSKADTKKTSDKSKKKEKKEADKKTKSNSTSNINVKQDKKSKKNSSQDESDVEPTTSSNHVTAVAKGGAVVDPLLPNCKNYSVVPDNHSEHNSKFFSATLNYSDVKNNNNKFYLIQLLREDNTNKYFLFTRWGRVGVPGSQSLAPLISLDQGKQSFLNKFHEKTTKGYDELIIDYSAPEEKKEAKKKDKKKSNTAKSTLPKPVQDLMELIYNINLMKQQMTEIGYDANKLPLGKLGKETLTQGYEILKEIEKVLDGKKKGDLYELSSNFYSKIPHNFGFQYKIIFL
jgi:poly [ADP-ribose] polymerase 2/3/4